MITQGTLTIHADRIMFHQNADNSLSATAYGNPVTFREKRDGVDEYYEGYAQRVVYNGQKRFLELFDRALLKKSGDEIRSNYITYDAAADVFKAEGRPDSRPPDAGEMPAGIARARRVPAAVEGGQVGEGREGDQGRQGSSGQQRREGRQGYVEHQRRQRRQGDQGQQAGPTPKPPRHRRSSRATPRLRRRPQNDGCARA